jgi:hypothetical protein
MLGLSKEVRDIANSFSVGTSDNSRISSSRCFRLSRSSKKLDPTLVVPCGRVDDDAHVYRYRSRHETPVCAT